VEIKRDTAKRGYNAEQVIEELEKRESDSRDFIRPQREFADIIVQFVPQPASRGGGQRHLDVRLVLRPTIPHPTELPLDNAESSLAVSVWTWAVIVAVRWTFLRSKARHCRTCRQAGESNLQHLPDIAPLGADQFGEYQDSSDVRHSDPLALTQLLLISHLLREHSATEQMSSRLRSLR